MMRNQLLVFGLSLIFAQFFAGTNCLQWWNKDKHDRRARQIGTSYVISVKNTGSVSSSRHKRNVEEKPTIKSLIVKSNINARFTTTTISSEMMNSVSQSKEAKFIVQIPETAFISNYTMYIDGEWFVANVKEKKAAEKEYEEAKRQNKTAGMVSSDNRQQPERGMEFFSVSVNVKANSSVLFELQYLELMQRRMGVFEQRISIRPQQIVENLRIEIQIYEPQGIQFVDVVEPAAGTNSVSNVIAQITHTSAEVKEITYYPGVDQQKDMNKTSGINGDLIIRYDTEHPYDAGLVQFEDDYFVHFFSPNDPSLVPLSKNVIFVIDISGSMGGSKISQTKTSMQAILGQLRNEDQFMLLLFDDQLEFWPSNGKLVQAHGDNIYQAKKYANERLVADGGTNIHSGLIKAAQILKSIGQTGANMVVFLTDGEPTSGVTDRSQIIKDVSSETNGRVAIFSLGYGLNLDYDLLAAVSYETGGFAKRIYEDVDASLQLENFFKEVNSPLGYNVEVVYMEAEVDFSSLTKYKFPQYFNGSEIVVAGKRKDRSGGSLNTKVKFVTSELVELPKVIDTSVPMPIPESAIQTYQPGFLEKLYVYMKIKDLLLQKLIAGSEDEKSEIENYALQLALDYNLVTPLTSMIIVQPDQQNYMEEDAMDMSNYPMSGRAYSSGDKVSFCIFLIIHMLWLHMTQLLSHQ